MVEIFEPVRDLIGPVILDSPEIDQVGREGRVPEGCEDLRGDRES